MNKLRESSAPRIWIVIWLSVVLCTACSTEPSPRSTDVGQTESPQMTECRGGKPIDLDECSTRNCPAPGACVLGTCVVDARECSPLLITCTAVTPTCPMGQVPSVVDGCWGECVDLASCNYLSESDCGLCAANGQMCVKLDLEQVVHVHCVDPPPASCDPVTCDCFGNEVCGEFGCVSVGDGTVECSSFLQPQRYQTDEGGPCYDGAAGTNVVMGTQLPDGGFTVEVLPQP